MLTLASHSYALLSLFSMLVQYNVHTSRKVTENETVMTLVTVWHHYMMCVIILECHVCTL